MIHVLIESTGPYQACTHAHGQADTYTHARDSSCRNPSEQWHSEQNVDTHNLDKRHCGVAWMTDIVAGYDRPIGMVPLHAIEFFQLFICPSHAIALGTLLDKTSNDKLHGRTRKAQMKQWGWLTLRSSKNGIKNDEQFGLLCVSVPVFLVMCQQQVSRKIP